MRNVVFIELQSKLACDPDRVICYPGPESDFRQITAGITQLTPRERGERALMSPTPHLHFN